jgi:hypothetical protein
MAGFVALGGEAGSWYVIRQHAQNSADAAAYSGAIRLACTIALGTSCPDAAKTVTYRGREFAAQNGFCDASDSTSYSGSRCATSLPTGTSQAVTIDIGDYSGGTFTTPPTSNGGTGNAVRAKVSQQQNGSFAAILGLTTINIPTQAIALVQNNPLKVCGLGLDPTQSSLWIGGSINLAGNGCGLQSDGTVKYSSTPTVTGSNWAFYGTTGCVGSSSECSNPGAPHNYDMLYASDPLSILNSQSFNSASGHATNNPCGNTYPCTLPPNTPTAPYGNLPVTTNHSPVHLSPGTYFFYNANINLNGGTLDCPSCTWSATGACTAGVNIVILGSSSLSVAGGATVKLCAAPTNATYPALNGVLIDDQAPTASSNNVNINGGGTVELDGAMYFPNVGVQWGGTTSATSNTCAEVIGNTLTFTGNAYLNTNNCTPNTFLFNLFVALVQ